MTSVFASRRRAEEFNSLVEAPAPGALRDARLEEFLAVVESLRTVPDAEPRPEFVGSLRADLMSAADTLLLPATQERLTLPPRTAKRDRRIAAAIGAIAVVGAGTSMAVAAQSALPGEMLYPLKRAIEDAETTAASGRDAKALTLLDSATSRLSELQALGREGELTDEGGAVSTNFTDFGTQANQAADYILDDYAETGDRDLIRELRDFTGASMATLQDLEAAVPSSAHDELVAAVDVVGDIDALARQACPSCGGEGIEQIPPVLLGSAATEATGVVVIPGATVKTWHPRGDDRRGGSATEEADGEGESLPTDPIVTAPETSSPSTGGGSSEPAAPLDDLTDALEGDGGDPPASNDGGAGAGAGDTLEDTVDDTVDDTGKLLEDTTDELGDTLLGP